MTPEQIEQSVYSDFAYFNWESGESISSASAYAQFLFEAGTYFFHVPATGAFFSVWRDGNYYHGYETIVSKCSKSEVLDIVKRQLAYVRSTSGNEKRIAYWETLCSRINEC